jgi:hypothetical protein
VTSAAEPSYLTRQIQAEDTVGVQEGLEPDALRRAVVDHHVVQQCEQRDGIKIVGRSPDALGYRVSLR